MSVNVRSDIERLARFYVTDPHDTCDPHEARELAQAFLLERERAERLERERSEVLEPDEVCACLNETGERKVRVYERCERCHALMETDLVAERDRAVAALEYVDERVKELEQLLAFQAEGATGDPADCPADHGEQCCRHPDLCRAALAGEPE